MEISSSYSFSRLLVLLLALYGVQGIIFPGATVRVAMQLFIVLVITYAFASVGNYIKNIKFEGKIFIVFYVLCGLFISVRSFFVADSYEQWRYLVTSFMPTLLLGIFSIICVKLEIFFMLIRMIIFIVLPFSIIFIIAGPSGKNANSEYIRYISIFYLLIAIIPVLRIKWKLLAIAFSVITVAFDLTNRSNMLSISGAFAICFIYYVLIYFKKYGGNFSGRITLFISALLIFIPVVFSALGAFSDFNIFEDLGNRGDVELIDAGDGRKNNVDSRTVVYRDAYNGLDGWSGWVFGNSATYLYSTELADTLEGYEEGRLGASESFLVGHLMFGGLMYVVSFFAIILYVAYKGIFYSNNLLTKILVLFISFRWFFSFIESPIGFNFYWVITFMIFGIILSDDFRRLSDLQVNSLIERVLKI